MNKHPELIKFWPEGGGGGQGGFWKRGSVSYSRGVLVWHCGVRGECLFTHILDCGHLLLEIPYILLKESYQL